VANSFVQVFKVPETRQKILATLGLLLVYRLGFHIPMPGMNPAFVEGHAKDSVWGMISAFSGGAWGEITLFGLGIMPYISASIIFSMLTKVSPAIEAIQKEGAAGQKRINQWTRLATVPIAVIQALFVFSTFVAKPELIAEGMRDQKFALALVVVLSLVAGSMFVMWIGELITEYGVGNGSSLIIMAGIIAQIPVALHNLYQTPEFWQTLLLLICVWVVTVTVVVFIHKGARRVPIQYARLSRGNQAYGGQRHYLPLKINMAGVMPIVFASVIFVIPALILQWVGLSRFERVFSENTGFVHVTLLTAMVFFFCFFWNRLMFQPNEIADNLREHGSFIPGIRPGAKTAEYLNNVLTRITLAGAAFLAVIAVLPAFVVPSGTIPPDLMYFLGGTSVLIVVGVALDLVDRLNAQLVMRNYEGFMKTSGPGWTRGGAQGGQSR
jgi:preprotein translocase subunit SecY